jgi:hypothetical protein
MRAHRLAVLVFSCLFWSLAAPAWAQGHGATSAPVPVSPGGQNKLRPANACPTFNWAPVDGAAAYELGVFPLEQRQTLAADPALRKFLPGRAAGWTPSAGECLAPGEYVWFIRQAASTGDPIGPWSPGLAITIEDAPQSPELDSTATATTAGGGAAIQVAASGQGKPATTPPPNNNDVINAKLDEINGKLDDLLAPVSRQLCFQVGGALEIGSQFGGDLNGEFEGRVGAEGFGNGVMGKVKAKPGWGFAAAFKGAASPTFTICRSLNPIFSAPTTSAMTRAAAPLGPSGLSDDEFTTRILALADKLQINDDRIGAALDALPDFSATPDAWSALQSDGPVAKLADIVPLPDGLRDTLRNPGQIIANMRAQLALCSQSNLPAVVEDLVQEFCGLASSERFSKLLDRVDAGVTTVKGTADSIRTKVDNIIDRLPTEKDCKFFCGS